jgi:hypothetical protein
MYLRVKEDLRLSNNKQELNRSVKNYGILVCEIIRNDFRYNSYNPFEEPCEVSSLDSKTMIPPSLQQRINEVKAAEKEKDDETKGEDEQSDPDSDVESKKQKKTKNPYPIHKRRNRCQIKRKLFFIYQVKKRIQPRVISLQQKRKAKTVVVGNHYHANMIVSQTT